MGLGLSSGTSLFLLRVQPIRGQDPRPSGAAHEQQPGLRDRLPAEQPQKGFLYQVGGFLGSAPPPSGTPQPHTALPLTLPDSYCPSSPDTQLCSLLGCADEHCEHSRHLKKPQPQASLLPLVPLTLTLPLGPPPPSCPTFSNSKVSA